ncbi:hypothetical protein DH2020_018473 [Rehmannia glutinosa]|uniref:Transmembrane protein n=1 Tax=Rehmannia glutinosa TaxID=99300 RepID=A0ABR0WJ12_REHGL
MDGLRKAYHNAISQAHESTAKLSSFSASLNKTKSVDSSSSSSGIDPHLLFLLTSLLGALKVRKLLQSVPLWTCSKLCAICFVAGVIVGYTMKRRVRRWASKLLRRLKDD